jgi:hypothetical protein
VEAINIVAIIVMKVAYKPGFRKSFCVIIPELCVKRLGIVSTTNINPYKHVNPAVNPITNGFIFALIAKLIMIGIKVTTAVAEFEIILWKTSAIVMIIMTANKGFCIIDKNQLTLKY